MLFELTPFAHHEDSFTSQASGSRAHGSIDRRQLAARVAAALRVLVGRPARDELDEVAEAMLTSRTWSPSWSVGARSRAAGRRCPRRG